MTGPTRCAGCPLAPTRRGFVPGDGPLDARLVVIGEAPGRDEIAAQPPRPFIGKSGRILRGRLDTNVPTYITNVRKCLPPDDETPDTHRASVDHCVASYLQPELDLLGNARVIHAVGADAAGVVAAVGSVLEAQGAVFTRAEVEAMVRAALESNLLALTSGAEYVPES